MHTCGDKIEVGWATGSYRKEWGFRPMYSMTQKLYKPLGWPTWGSWTCTESMILNAKLWQRFKLKRWQSYEVITACIIGICQFRKSVANCDTLPNYKGGQLHTLTVHRWICTTKKDGGSYQKANPNSRQRGHQYVLYKTMIPSRAPGGASRSVPSLWLGRHC